MKQRLKSFYNLMDQSCKGMSYCFFIYLSLLLVVDVELDESDVLCCYADYIGDLDNDGEDIVLDVGFVVEVAIAISLQEF